MTSLTFIMWAGGGGGGDGGDAAASNPSSRADTPGGAPASDAPVGAYYVGEGVDKWLEESVLGRKPGPNLARVGVNRFRLLGATDKALQTHVFDTFKFDVSQVDIAFGYTGGADAYTLRNGVVLDADRWKAVLRRTGTGSVDSDPLTIAAADFPGNRKTKPPRSPPR
jgi:hypothetical protein